MSYPVAELQKSIYAALADDAQLQTLLAGRKIYDHPPEKAALPYIILGRITSTDWSTSSEEGMEHFINLHIWSKRSGRDEIYQIQERVFRLLDDEALTLDAQHLVNLQLELSEVRRDANTYDLHGTMRFRAVTEPLTN